MPFIEADPNGEVQDGDITFYDKHGKPLTRYTTPSFEGMTNDEIAESGAFGDPDKAKELFRKLEKSFEKIEKSKEDKK